MTGVVIDGGAVLRADLVVDATGRRSPVGAMIESAGGRRPHEEREDSGFVYYARHFRSADGSRPAALGTLLQHFDSLSVLTLPCDNDTWGVGFITSARDKQLRGLRDTSAWQAALKLYPTVAHWGEAEPITDVQVIAGIEDRYHRYVVDGEPVVTGLVAVGDAWACTNPSLGRGASIGMLHACALRDLLRDVSPDQPEKLVRRFDEITESTVTPLYRMTLAFDRHRLNEIAADVAGETYQTLRRRLGDDQSAVRRRTTRSRRTACLRVRRVDAVHSPGGAGSARHGRQGPHARRQRAPIPDAWPQPRGTALRDRRPR